MKTYIKYTFDGHMYTGCHPNMAQLLDDLNKLRFVSFYQSPDYDVMVAVPATAVVHVMSIPED